MLESGNHTDGNDEVVAAGAEADSMGTDAPVDPDPSTGIVYEAGDAQAISTAVVFAIAEFRGIDPIGLADETVLGETINLELLDELSTGPGRTAGAWTLEFSLPEERVTVSSDGRVTVDAD